MAKHIPLRLVAVIVYLNHLHAATFLWWLDIQRRELTEGEMHTTRKGQTEYPYECLKNHTPILRG